MLRRFLCLTTILLTLLSLSACGEKKADKKAPGPPDPDADAKPALPNAKGG
jgi:hypothetical protein